MSTIKTNDLYGFYSDIIMFNLEPTSGMKFHREFYLQYLTDGSYRNLNEDNLILIIENIFHGIFKSNDDVEVYLASIGKNDDGVYVIPIKQNPKLIISQTITYNY